MTHTPGPWKLDHEGPGLLTVEATDGREDCVLAEIPHSGDEDEANIRLMAAAPELKGQLTEMCFKADTAIQYLQSAFVGLEDGHAKGYLGGFIQEFRKRTAEARDVIAKTEGEKVPA